MKSRHLLLALLAVVAAVAGLVIASDGPGSADAAPGPVPPGFSPTETIRPDQGVAFPVDI
jgi:hypothetical protein